MRSTWRIPRGRKLNKCRAKPERQSGEDLGEHTQQLSHPACKLPMADRNSSAGQQVALSKGYFLWGCRRGVAESAWVRGFWEAVPGIASNGVEPWEGGEPPAWPGLRAGFTGSEQSQKGQVNKQGSVPMQSEGQLERHIDPGTSAALSSSPFTGWGEQGSGERPENRGVGERSHFEPGRLGSPLSQGCVRAEPKGGHYRQRLMSEGQFIFKPDSFVLKYEIMLSLWHVES